MSLLRSIAATIVKESLLIRRDLGGLLILLVMPAALIIIMALVQDAPFKDYQNIRFDLLLADEDGGPLAREIKQGLKQSKNFHVIDSIDGQPLQSGQLVQQLQSGHQHIGILIPKGASGEIANSANIIANQISAQMGSGQLPERESRDSVCIRLFFDPVSRPSFRIAIHSALEQFITSASSHILVQRISRLAGGKDSSSDQKLQRSTAGIGIRESMLNEDKGAGHINSVQHNVPAWAIFGMFFIVVPLSGHIIREREEGSTLRVRLIPGAEYGVGIGRILFNALICCLQFVCMCAVGFWLLPLFGLPSLSLGAHPLALIPIVIATALCATSYGYFIGSVFSSNAQALPFAAISIVILSALGGIWVPVDLLPHILQVVARFSPLHWSLLGVQNILLRDGNFKDIIQPALILCSLAIGLWMITMIRQAYHRQRV